MSVELFELYHYKTISAVYSIIFVLGFICNTIVIIVFLGTRSLRENSASYLLVSMTASDWMMAALSSSVGAYANSKYWWNLHPGFCQYFGFISSMVGYSSMVHITALAVEKWFTLKMARNEEIGKGKMLAILASLWFFAFLWALFPLVGWSFYAPEPGYAGCSVAWYANTAANNAFIICLFIFFFFIPICVVIFCFSSIYWEVRKLAIGAVQRWGQSSESSQETVRAKAKTIRMSLVMVLAFIIAWAPYAVVSLHSSFIANDLPPAFTTLPAMFAKLSTFYNPIIYFFMYTKFRNAAKRMFMRKSIWPQQTSGSASQSQNGSFMTSFPRPAQFFERMSGRHKRVQSVTTGQQSIDKTNVQSTSDDYVIQRLTIPAPAITPASL